jgi:hypothetical protein
MIELIIINFIITDISDVTNQATAPMLSTPHPTVHSAFATTRNKLVPSAAHHSALGIGACNSSHDGLHARCCQDYT